MFHHLDNSNSGVFPSFNKKRHTFASEERNAVDEQTKKEQKFDLAYKKTKIKKHDRLLTT